MQLLYQFVGACPRTTCCGCLRTSIRNRKVHGHSESMMHICFVLWCSKLTLCYISSSPVQTMLPHFQCKVPFKGSGGHACNTCRDQCLRWLKTLSPLLHEHWLKITRNCKANKHTRAALFRFLRTSPNSRLQVLKFHGKLRHYDDKHSENSSFIERSSE